MPFSSTIAFSLQWIDTALGTGRVVDTGSVTATVIDVEGNETVVPESSMVITPDPTVGATYTVPAFSIASIPGSHVTVKWNGLLGGVALTEVLKVEYFQPLSTGKIGTSTLLRWAEPAFAALFYEVLEVDTTGVVIRSIGTSDFPSLLDETEYANEAVARNTRYRIDYARPLETPNVTTGLPYEVVVLYAAGSLEVEKFRVNASLCLVRGETAVIDASPQRNAKFTLETDFGDLPVVVQGLHLSHREVIVPIMATGQFGVYLLQGTVVKIRMPQTNLTGRFAVPLQREANLRDLNIKPFSQRSAVE